MVDVKILGYCGSSYRNILGYLNELKDFEAKVEDGGIVYSCEGGSIRVSNSEGEIEGKIFLSGVSSKIFGDLEKLTGVCV